MELEVSDAQVRKVDMLEGITVVRSEKVKDELVLDGNDIELVSNLYVLSPNIEYSKFACYLYVFALVNFSMLYFVVLKRHVKNKDIRKFLDGIYVSEKGRIEEEEE